MNISRYGIIGSVAVIGLIYFSALAYADAPGVSAPNGQLSQGPAVSAVDAGTAAAVCPYVMHVEHATAGWFETDSGIFMGPAEVPSFSAGGTGRPMFF